MAQITEDYVSFETAKLLRVKGFDEPIEMLIREDGTRYHADTNSVSRKRHIMLRNSEINMYSTDISCPTLQMAMKWLREVHKLVICAEIGNENFKGNTNYSNPDRWYWFFDITNEKGVVIDTESDFISNEYATHEQACEAAIKYCLENLI